MNLLLQAGRLVRVGLAVLGILAVRGIPVARDNPVVQDNPAVAGMMDIQAAGDTVLGHLAWQILVLGMEL